MAFREKIAWAAFITTVIAWGGYFAMVVSQSGQTSHSAYLLWLFIAATGAQAVLMAAAAIIWSIQAPGEAQAPADERDRAVGQRATGIAYLVVILALIGVIIWLHFGLHGRNTVFALVGVFMLAEAARFGAQAIGYRRAA